jgi:hypothetical protein
MLLYSTKYTQKIKITVCNEEFKNELKVDQPTVCPISVTNHLSRFSDIKNL